MAVIASDELDFHDYKNVKKDDEKPVITKKPGHMCTVCQEKWYNEDEDCAHWMTYESAISSKRHELKEAFMAAAITGFALRGSDPIGLAKGANKAAEACVNEFMKVR